MAKKRANGEGSIFQRGKDKWGAALTLPNGKRDYFYGRTQSEVRAKLARAIRERDTGTVRPAGSQTVKSFLEQWLEVSAKVKVRPATYKSYAEIATLHLIPELGSKRLSSLAPADVQGLLTKKLDAGLSPRRVQYIRSVLRQALGQAMRWELVARNVAAIVEPPKVEQPKIAPFTADEVRALLVAARGDELESLYVLAISTGMRQSELLGLTWERVHLDERTLRVESTLQRLTGEFKLLEPKTRQSRRTLVLGTVAVEAFKRERAKQSEHRLMLGSDWKNVLGLVFTRPDGLPLEGTSVTKRFQRLLESAGLPKRRFHDLRHTYATLQLENGETLLGVKEALGHSTIVMTGNVYGHVTPSMREASAARMDAVLTASD